MQNPRAYRAVVVNWPPLCLWACEVQGTRCLSKPCQGSSENSDLVIHAAQPQDVSRR